MILIGKLLLILQTSVTFLHVVDRGYRQYLVAEAVRDYGGFVYYESDPDPDGGAPPARRPLAPAWLRRAVGEDFFQEVVAVNLVYGSTPNGARVDVKRTDDEIIPRLRELPHLKRLFIQEGQATDRAMETVAKLTDLEVLMMWDAKVSDAGVARLRVLKQLRNIHVSNAGLGDDSLLHLSTLPRLESMSLQGSRFTDKGLAHLKGMTQLKELVPDLGETDITDASMAQLAGLTNLERLGLQKTRVTDEGLKHLRGLKKLKSLWIGETVITPEGVEKLRADLPDLKASG